MNWMHGTFVAKRFSAALLSLALLGASAPNVDSAAKLSNDERVRAEIMPLFTAMERTANVHDAEAHLAFYVHSPALVFVANGAEIVGWDNLLVQQKKWWPGGKIAPADAAHAPYRMMGPPRFDAYGPRLAMVTFVLDARRVYPDKVMRRPLAISQLWQKLPDGWKVVYAHESFGPEQPEH